MPPVMLNDEQRSALRQAKMVSAYKRVFGAEASQRTEDQRLVWEDLQIAGYLRKPIFVPDRNNHFCPLRAAYADGRRSLFLYVEANVEFAPPKEEQPQQQPQKKRRTTDASES